MGASVIEATRSAQPEEVPAPRFSTIDLLTRLVLLTGFVFGLAWLEGTPLSGLYAHVPVFLVSAIYLAISVAPVSRWINQQVAAHPLLMALPPAALMAMLLFYASSVGLESAALLFFGMFLFLAVAAAILNAPALQRSDILLGLTLVAVPLAIPVIPDTPFSGQANDIPLAVRVSAFLPPLGLLVLTNSRQKRRLNLLFICALLALWYCGPFGALPSLPASDEAVAFPQLLVLAAILYAVAAGGYFDRLGLSFGLTPRQISATASNAVLLAATFIPAGLVTGVLIPAFSGPTLLEVLWRWLSFFLLQALPAEIVLRGVLITYLRNDVQLGHVAPVIASIFLSVVSGWPGLGWMLALTALAAVFYARIFLATDSIVASGIVHATLAWVLWLLFSA